MKKIYKNIENTLLSGKATTCFDIAKAASDIAGQIADDDVNEMAGEDKEHPCPCSGDGSGGGGESKLVDLIILIDSSSSMSAAARAVSGALVEAIEIAKKKCDKEAEVLSLYVDRDASSPDWPGGSQGTIFTQSHEHYLASKGYTGPFRTDDSDAPESDGYPGEEGAEAIIDLINHNPWREGACRAIFYISDEWLDGWNDPSGTRATLRSIEAKDAAMKNGVTLFAHHLVNPNYNVGNNNNLVSRKLYHDMVVPTGGFVVDGQDDQPGVDMVGLYVEVLTEAICKSCANSGGCASIEWPEVEPCVHVTWGASDCDNIESHDDEVVSITICNCYDNVTFKDVKLGYAVVVDEKGNLPPLLPDGSPSVHLYPTGPVCFGDLGPCEDGKETCASRQFVLLTRGAKNGKYKIKLGGLCYQTCRDHLIEDAEREFEICKD